jgi:hypothetical protein
MPRTGAILEATVSYYSTLAFDALKAMRDTQEELRTGQFKTDAFVARGLNFWLNSCEGLWSALLVTANGPLPNMFLRVTKSSTTGSAELRANVPKDPSFTGLQAVSGNASIPSSQYSVQKTSKGDGLEVKLVGLKPRPAPGLYVGLAHIEDTAVATVMVLIE